MRNCTETELDLSRQAYSPHSTVAALARELSTGSVEKAPGPGKATVGRGWWFRTETATIIGDQQVCVRRRRLRLPKVNTDVSTCAGWERVGEGVAEQFMECKEHERGDLYPHYHGLQGDIEGNFDPSRDFLPLVLTKRSQHIGEINHLGRSLACHAQAILNTEDRGTRNIISRSQNRIELPQNAAA